MSRFVSLLLTVLFVHLSAQAQDARQLIAAVRAKQAQLQRLTYTLARTDTLVTGTVRHLSGRAQIQVNRADSLFGFWFRAQQDGIASKVLYDGRVGYITDDSTKTYTLLTDPNRIRALLYQSGGRIIVPDLIQLDTSRAVRIQLSQDNRSYYLTLYYEDLKQEDVTDRFKTIAIDKVTLLPVSVRQHQQTLGNVQDLFYRITSLTLTNYSPDNSFRKPAFLTQYRQKTVPANRSVSVSTLLGKSAPAMHLTYLLNDSSVSLSFLGKVTLLDFWEVWCGPCLAAMPAVDELIHKYASKGLQVYGITHELSQLRVARRLIQQRNFQVPTLIGDDQSRQNYRVRAIPLYVVVDQKGNVAFVSEGFSSAIDDTIQKLLGQ